MIDEIWIDTGNTKGNAIVAISNMGRIKRKNGTIEYSTIRKIISINGKLTYIYRYIAKHFLPQTDEDITLGRNQVDHITHYPTDMNVNDVRNLRWATAKENSNFPEAIENRSKAQKGIKKGKAYRKTLLNKPKTEFGRMYIEHYGFSKAENPKQYDRESRYYRYHGKCRWE